MQYDKLTKWRRRGLLALCGMCAALALPPLFLLPLLIPAFTGLCVITATARNRLQAFADGWCWGLGYFTAGLYWICISLYVEPEKFAWLTPFALFGLPSVLGIYTGAVTLVWYILPGAPTRKLPAFMVLWVISEWLRAHLFTGFPWNLIGYAWNISDVTMQGASVIGIYGMSALAVLLASIPSVFVWRVPAKLPVILACVALAGLVLFGVLRLEQHPTRYTATQIRVVQGNIPQRVKFNPETELAGLQAYAKLSDQPGIDHIDAVIWPEVTVPYLFEENSPLSHDLGTVLPPKAILLTGGMHGVKNPNGWQLWNSLFAIDSKGALLAQYDKHHLVPFGEYIPLRHILPVEAIAGGLGDFERGQGPQTLRTGTIAPFSPLICYEAIFPDEAVDGGNPEWLLTITNDAWFGKSSGPYQHLQMARMRAVEQGIPLVRAANTGISAIVDSYGRVLQHLPLNQAGILDAALPQKADEKTLYTRFTYLQYLFIVATFAIFTWALRRTQ